MSEPAEIAFWKGAVVPWPNDVVSKMALASDDATYLTEVGLPTGVDWTLRIEPPIAGADPRRVKGLPVLAFDGTVPICVDQNAQGSVVALEESGRRLVNSTVRRFGVCLMIYEDYRQRVRELDEQEAQILIGEIEQRMKSADAAACVSENYWPVVIEQMRHGLL